MVKVQRPQSYVSDRAELQALKAQADAMSSLADVEDDKVKPILELFGSYGLKSQEKNLSESVSKVEDPYRPKSVVGLSFRFSLDPELTNHQLGRRACVRKLQIYNVKTLNRR